HEGDFVTKGQSLARIDNPSVASALDEATAAVGSAEAKAEKAGSTLERVSKLYQEGIVARREVDDAKAESAAAAGGLRPRRADRARGRRGHAVAPPARARRSGDDRARRPRERGAGPGDRAPPLSGERQRAGGLLERRRQDPRPRPQGEDRGPRRRSGRDRRRS